MTQTAASSSLQYMYFKCIVLVVVFNKVLNGVEEMSDNMTDGWPQQGYKYVESAS